MFCQKQNSLMFTFLLSLASSPYCFMAFAAASFALWLIFFLFVDRCCFTIHILCSGVVLFLWFYSFFIYVCFVCLQTIQFIISLSWTVLAIQAIRVSPKIQSNATQSRSTKNRWSEIKQHPRLCLRVVLSMCGTRGIHYVHEIVNV